MDLLYGQEKYHIDDLDNEGAFERNILKITNPNSHFMLILNANSHDEYESQFVPFFESHNIIPKYGISQTGNITTWIHTTTYSSAHSANPLKIGLSLASYLMEKQSGGHDLNELTNISALLNEVLHEKYTREDSIRELSDDRDVFLIVSQLKSLQPTRYLIDKY